MRFPVQLPALAAALMLMATLAAQAQPAGAASTIGVTEASSQQQQQKRVIRRVAPQPSTKIACTVYGCHPIPPGCTPVTQYTRRGNPTGYDAVLCR